MLQLDNIATQDAYNDADTLSDQQSDLLSLSVGLADIYMRVRRYDEQRHNLLDYGDEIRVTAPTHLLMEDVAGVQVRSAEPGTPASVTAQLFQPDEPRPSAASAAVQVLTTVGQLGFQHEDTLVAASNNADFEDTATLAWSITEDAPNQRVKIAGTVPGAPPTGAAAGDLAGTYPSPSVDGLQGRPVAATPPSANQGLVWTGSTWAPAALVNSFNGRQGAVLPQAGDYTAAQVTNAADRTSASEQDFASAILTPNILEVAAVANVGFGGTVTPIVDAEGLLIITWAGGGGLTIANPGHLAAGKACLFVIAVLQSGGPAAITWGSAYRFGAWTSTAPGAGNDFAWLFLMTGNLNRAVCIGTSNGVFT